MPASTSRAHKLSKSHDPLEPLAVAIGSLLNMNVVDKPNGGGSLSVQVSRALHQVLEARTPQSRSARMLLIRHLADIENQQTGIEIPSTRADADDFISTAQAALILGYSRPYVAMLIDQNQLEGATLSAGGHRRVPRAAVLAWKDKHQLKGKTADPGADVHEKMRTSIRVEGQKIGAYKSTEADVLQRLKALASSAR